MSENDNTPQHQLTEQQRLQQAENEANGVNSPAASSSEAAPVQNAPTPDSVTQPEDNDPESNVGSPADGE